MTLAMSTTFVINATPPESPRIMKARIQSAPEIHTRPTARLLQCHAKSEDFIRKLLPRFTLSDELYIPSQTTFLPTPSTFLTLPAELLGLIFEHIAHVPSQIALALTCKQMASIARPLNLSLSTTSPKYAGFLPREVFDIPALMQSLTKWMPATLRLCDHCLTMRPCDLEYWADVAGCERDNYWIAKTGWHFANASWHKQVHNVCPACHTTCSLSDFVDCDGCRALGRLGDVDWTRVSDHWMRRHQAEMVAAAAAERAAGAVGANELLARL